MAPHSNKVGVLKTMLLISCALDAPPVKFNPMILRCFSLKPLMADSSRIVVSLEMLAVIWTVGYVAFTSSICSSVVSLILPAPLRA